MKLKLMLAATAAIALASCGQMPPIRGPRGILVHPLGGVLPHRAIPQVDRGDLEPTVDLCGEGDEPAVRGPGGIRAVRRLGHRGRGQELWVRPIRIGQIDLVAAKP